MRRLAPLALAALLASAGLSPVRAADAPAKPAEAPKPADAPKAAEGAKADDGFVSVFNGKDLTGWVTTGTAKAAVEDGHLVILDGDGLVRLDKVYGDFVFEIEWKNRKADKFDSGIYFRSEPAAKGQKWPAKYQVNLQQGREGSLVGSATAVARGMAKPGEWNRLRLTVVGKHAEVEVNGMPAWKYENITPEKGLLGIQCEVPGGGQFEFRNIRVKALTPPTEAPKE
ncbi:MAG TPA: DUF1080 domain-containing protein [Humisphaera sp.]